MPDDETKLDRDTNANDNTPENKNTDVDSLDKEPDTSSNTSNAETSQPVAQPESAQRQNTPQPKKSGHKKAIISGVAGLILLLLIGGSALAYNLWYQNPQKVITDGFVHLFNKNQELKTKSSVAIKSDEAEATLNMNGQAKDGKSKGKLNLHVDLSKTDGLNLKPFDIPIDYAADTSAKTSYIKANNIKKTVADFIDVYLDTIKKQYQQYGYDIKDSTFETQKTQLMAKLNPILEKIDGQWIEVKADNQTSSQDKSTRCYTDAFQKLQSDKSRQSEIAKAYRENQFVHVDKSLGSKDGSLGYELSIDKTKSKRFSDAVKNTETGKAFAKCDTNSSSTQPTDDNNDDVKNVKFEVWVSRWSHKITGAKLHLESTDMNQTNLDANISMDYTAVGDISMPKNAKSFDELRKDFENIQSTPSFGPTSISSTT